MKPIHSIKSKLVVYTIMPVTMLNASLPQSVADVFPTFSDNQPTVETTVKPIDTAVIVAERFPLAVQMPFMGGNVTTKFSYWHPGIDLSIAAGTPMKPIANGKVIAAGWQTGYGRAVVIDHGNGVTSLSAHMTKIGVKVGQEVNTDTVIGTVGSTGRSTGPHLHLEVTKDGSRVDPLVLLPIALPNAIALATK